MHNGRCGENSEGEDLNNGKVNIKLISTRLPVSKSETTEIISQNSLSNSHQFQLPLPNTINKDTETENQSEEHLLVPEAIYTNNQDKDSNNDNDNVLISNPRPPTAFSISFEHIVKDNDKHKLPESDAPAPAKGYIQSNNYNYNSYNNNNNNNGNQISSVSSSSSGTSGNKKVSYGTVLGTSPKKIHIIEDDCLDNCICELVLSPVCGTNRITYGKSV